MRKELIVLSASIIVCIPLVGCSSSHSAPSQNESSVLSDSAVDYENSVSAVPDETNNNTDPESGFNEFLLRINPDIEKNDISKLADSYGLYSDGKNNGTGHYTYRFSEDKEVANVNKTAKGSVITVTYNLLSNDEMEEISYFDDSRMVAGFWNPDSGYTMIDYNNPQLVSDSHSSKLLIASFSELVDYVPEISSTDNLLEELFVSVSDSTTKNDVLDYVNSNNLAYDPRGKGNEQLIAYSADVIKKFGENGSYITFDCDSNDLITSMSYYEYPYNYRTGNLAVYYSSNYPYSDLEGYYLIQNKEEPIKFDSARSLIDEVNSNRQ
ncbi:MAG: hypothetical protein J5851_10540 [Oscillospiraceae bacterium]|nr:hypothetical protein [Oscillospiraceae bacterium]